MLWFFLILLVIASFFSILLCILSKVEIRRMTHNLKEINDTKTNANVRLSSPNRQMEMLAAEINRTIAKRQEAEALYKRMNLNQRQNIANISHDLRTPLTSVLGYIQLLEDETLTEEERKKYIEIIQNRGQDLNALITGFFDLSRLEAGEYSFELRPISLQNILCEILASFYLDFTGKEIEPDISVDQTAPAVIGDENAVRRVFSNLIQNSLKYGGETIRVSLKRDAEFVRVCFSNDAPQLTQEDVRHLFERFYTAERIRSGHNTGLGLAITKQLAEKMNAEIAADISGGELTVQIKWKVSK